MTVSNFFRFFSRNHFLDGASPFNGGGGVFQMGGGGTQWGSLVLMGGGGLEKSCRMGGTPPPNVGNPGFKYIIVIYIYNADVYSYAVGK